MTNYQETKDLIGKIKKGFMQKLWRICIIIKLLMKKHLIELQVLIIIINKKNMTWNYKIR